MQNVLLAKVRVTQAKTRESESKYPHLFSQADPSAIDSQSIPTVSPDALSLRHLALVCGCCRPVLLPESTFLPSLSDSLPFLSQPLQDIHEQLTKLQNSVEKARPHTCTSLACVFTSRMSHPTNHGDWTDA
jgi:hypothetical protein